MTTDTESADDADAEIDPETTFLEEEVLEPCADDDDLCVVEAVRREWRDRMDELRDGDREEQVVTFLELDPTVLAKLSQQGRGLGLEVKTHEDTGHVYVRVKKRLVARWESDAAMLADLAGADVLAAHVSDWADLDVDRRSQLASGLRAFLERCPTCEGAISLSEDTVESCCRSRQVYAITCDDCEAKLLEVDR